MTTFGSSWGANACNAHRCELIFFALFWDNDKGRLSISSLTLIIYSEIDILTCSPSSKTSYSTKIHIWSILHRTSIWKREIRQLTSERVQSLSPNPWTSNRVRYSFESYTRRRALERVCHRFGWSLIHLDRFLMPRDCTTSKSYMSEHSTSRWEGGAYQSSTRGWIAFLPSATIQTTTSADDVGATCSASCSERRVREIVTYSSNHPDPKSDFSSSCKDERYFLWPSSSA